MEIAIDFDGTCTTHEFPKIGKDIGAVPVLKRLVAAGHNLILFTMRSDRAESGETGHELIADVTGAFLSDAVQWFADNDIPLHGIQKNPTQHNWTTSPKCYAQLYIDDAALGCPRKYDPEISEQPFVDWDKVAHRLEIMRIIPYQPTQSDIDNRVSGLNYTNPRKG